MNCVHAGFDLIRDHRPIAQFSMKQLLCIFQALVVPNFFPTSHMLASTSMQQPAQASSPCHLSSSFVYPRVLCHNHNAPTGVRNWHCILRPLSCCPYRNILPSIYSIFYWNPQTPLPTIHLTLLLPGAAALQQHEGVPPLPNPCLTLAARRCNSTPPFARHEVTFLHVQL